MKIACICNLNQLQFTTARHLQDNGYDVTLFLMEEYEHFLPEYDTWETPLHLKVKNLPWKAETFWQVSPKEIKNTFKDYTFLIGSEWSPAFLARIGRTLNVFLPIGTDLIEYPFQYTEQKTYLPWQWEFKKRSELQKWGILNSNCTYVNLNGDTNLENAFSKIGFDDKKRFKFSLPTLHLKSFEKSVFQQAYLDIEKTIKDIKSKTDYIFISPNRISYTTNTVHNKGTEIILNGFAEFLKNTNCNAKLFFCEYGTDIEVFKLKIKELNLENNIFWLPLLPRKIMVPILKLFNLGFGNLKQVAYLSSISMELAASKVPILQLGAPINLTNDIPVPPYFSVSNSSEIANALNKFIKKEPEFLNNFSSELNWYDEKVVKPAIKSLCNQIDNTNKITYKNWNKFIINIKHALISKFSPLLYRLNNKNEQ